MRCARGTSSIRRKSRQEAARVGSEGEIVVSVGAGRDIVRCCCGLCVSVGGGLRGLTGFCLGWVREHAAGFLPGVFVAGRRLELGLCDWICMLLYMSISKKSSCSSCWFDLIAGRLMSPLREGTQGSSEANQSPFATSTSIKSLMRISSYLRSSLTLYLCSNIYTLISLEYHVIPHSHIIGGSRSIASDLLPVWPRRPHA